MMIPKDTRQDAIIMEFKVQDGEEEKIRHYGFAFEGKKVLIGGEKINSVKM